MALSGQCKHFVSGLGPALEGSKFTLPSILSKGSFPKHSPTLILFAAIESARVSKLYCNSLSGLSSMPTQPDASNASSRGSPNCII